MPVKPIPIFILAFLLLSACQNPPTPPEAAEPNTPQPVSTVTAVPTLVLATATAVPPTATPPAHTQPTPTLSAEEAITARLQTLEAQFSAAFPIGSEWLFRRETVYEPANADTAVTYRALGDNWVYELWIQPSANATISQQIMHVYDNEGGLWERSAVLDMHNVTVLPEQTLEGPVVALNDPVPYRTAHQDIMALISQANSGDVSAWEDNGRYHVQLLTSTSRATFSFDMETGAFLQQRVWQLAGDDGDTLLIDVNVVETAVVTQLPPLAAQTLLDAQTMLATSGN